MDINFFIAGAIHDLDFNFTSLLDSCLIGIIMFIDNLGDLTIKSIKHS